MTAPDYSLFGLQAILYFLFNSPGLFFCWQIKHYEAMMHHRKPPTTAKKGAPPPPMTPVLIKTTPIDEERREALRQFDQLLSEAIEKFLLTKKLSPANKPKISGSYEADK